MVTYRYDEYGGWGSGNSGTFYYTGQTGYTELGLYYYKSRWRHPKLDRFMQPDPIGYGAGMNLYAYVGGDPVNFTDPLGLRKRNKPDIPPKRDGSSGGGGGGTITVTGNRADQALRDTLVMLNRIATHEFIHRSGMGSNGESPNDDIVITGHQRQPNLSSVLPPPQPAVVSAWSLPSGATLAAERPKSRDQCTAVPDRVGGVDLSGPCFTHDRCYVSSTPRAQCDMNFYWDIHNQCRRQGGDEGACHSLAAVYYAGVRAAGWRFYSPPKDQ